MRAKYKNVIIAVFAGAFLCVMVFVVASVIEEISHETSLRSAYSGLETSLIIELDSYYRQNAKYPDSLNMLSDIEYSDGATPEMLSNFKYEVGGDSCSISHRYVPHGSKRTVYMSKGEIIRSALDTGAD